VLGVLGLTSIVAGAGVDTSMDNDWVVLLVLLLSTGRTVALTSDNVTASRSRVGANFRNNEICSHKQVQNNADQNQEPTLTRVYN
jgi:hypothetical protein